MGTTGNVHARAGVQACDVLKRDDHGRGDGGERETDQVPVNFAAVAAEVFRDQGERAEFPEDIAEERIPRPGNPPAPDRGARSPGDAPAAEETDEVIQSAGVEAAEKGAQALFPPGEPRAPVGAPAVDGVPPEQDLVL